MVSGGTRFTRPERPADPGGRRIIDAEVRSPHKTLYEVLAVPPRTASREIRKIARGLRRQLPESSALHDVCLAEQVLGRAELRAEYDGLLARLRAAKQPLPSIGTAIEGSRLGPSLLDGLSRSGRAGGRAVLGAAKLVLIALAIFFAFVLLGALVGSHRSSRYRVPPPPPIVIPKLDMKPFEVKPLDLPRLDPRVFEHLRDTPMQLPETGPARAPHRTEPPAPSAR